MTKENRNQFLESVYDFIQIEKKENIQINKQNNDHYRDELQFIGYWEDKGCIEVISKALGFTIFKLTSFGIDYVEENLK